MLLGCIGDDFTGSGDIANTLARAGMAVTQYCDVPEGRAQPHVEAGVVALKSRTIPAVEAVRKSLAAADWLLAQGCEQLVFKYCSTFDSTHEGNIGPVATALAECVGEDRVVMCPAFPANGRSVYQGHLFVDDRLLSDSGMRDHPLTPMTEADLRRWLACQTDWQVAHIGAGTVFQGAHAIARALAATGKALIVVDAILDQDLIAIGHAVADRKLVTGGSGIALGLADNFRAAGRLGKTGIRWRGAKGGGAVLSGSCSVATRRQIARHRQFHPCLEIDVDGLIEGAVEPASVAGWLSERLDASPLAHTSADPQSVRATQEKHGRDRAADAVERFFAGVARGLVDRGARKIVTAGGETSGAVVEGLAIEQLELGPEIAPGVPAVRDPQGGLCLALKSGNFGQDDFFARALSALGPRDNGADA